MLLDTNVVVDLLRQRTAAEDFFRHLRRRPKTSVICAMELFAGARSRAEEGLLEKFLELAQPLPVTVPIARRAGEFLRHYRDSHGVGDPDALIAATAEHHGLALATRNVKHFPMFKGLKPVY